MDTNQSRENHGSHGLRIEERTRLACWFESLAVVASVQADSNKESRNAGIEERDFRDRR